MRQGPKVDGSFQGHLTDDISPIQESSNQFEMSGNNDKYGVVDPRLEDDRRRSSYIGQAQTHSF